MSAIPRIIRNASIQNNVWECETHANVASGTVTFNLTTDGTSTGPAIFPNAVFTESINLMISDTGNTYNYGVGTIGTGNKTITFTVNKVGLSLAVLVWISAANGVTVYLTVKGN